MSKRKLRVGVIMGGRSGEHEISIISAASVIEALDKNKYEVVPIGITKTGKWLAGADTVKLLKNQSQNRLLEKILLPDPGQKSLMAINNSQIKPGQKLDVVIPMVHGTYGEDGKLQGLLELVDLPYVGAGVLGSAVGMDKIIMKKIFKESGLKTPDFVYFTKSEWLAKRQQLLKDIEKQLKYPVFVKPANSGSSVGINKAKNRQQLIISVKEAAKFDRRIIVEQAVKNCREIECAVLGNDQPRASLPGEVKPTHEFYSYAAKYLDEQGAALEIPAKLSKQLIKQVREMAVRAFRALDLAGMARVDFFLNPSGQVYLNEVNTIPGFTKISMYPKLWHSSGLSYPKLLDELIKLAISRHQEKQNLRTSYQVKDFWSKAGC
ncbi:MAG: D-alanine--D-alanine ligase [Candidatus Magasanikbacteria bacterium]|nr:D-alanine--D-alanine ligase [Candidatus Magasanikbacteria bacterium]